MTYFIIVALFLLLVAYTYSYYKDWKEKKLIINRKTLLTNPISLFILVSIFSHLLNGIKNIQIKQDQYLEAFNKERTKYGLVPITSNLRLKKKLFNSWYDYFHSVKRDYDLDLFSIDSNIHRHKSLVIKDNQLLFETDYYQFNNRSLEVAYNYNERVCSYKYYSHSDTSLPQEVIPLDKQQVADTLNSWIAMTKVISTNR